MESTSITAMDVMRFCAMNDRIGNPVVHTYTKYIQDAMVSPSSLRYIYHAHIILTHMLQIGNLNVDVIELGGGYGGLCLALHYFSEKYGVAIKSYKICDLPNIIALQKMYLDIVSPDIRVDFVNSTRYGEDIHGENLFLISNYCFSEIDSNHQQMYIQKMFPKVAHGFMVWNHIQVYDFGFNLTIHPEVPITYSNEVKYDNKYVFF